VEGRCLAIRRAGDGVSRSSGGAIDGEAVDVRTLRFREEKGRPHYAAAFVVEAGNGILKNRGAGTFESVVGADGVGDDARPLGQL